MTEHMPAGGTGEEDILLVSVEDAARMLHNSTDSIRRKLRAGRLQGERDSAGVWTGVYIPAAKAQQADSTGGQADTRPPGHTRTPDFDAVKALISEKDARISDLQHQVENLQGQVSALSERLAYADQERLALLSRIPALEDHSQERRGLFGWFRRKG